MNCINPTSPLRVLSTLTEKITKKINQKYKQPSSKTPQGWLSPSTNATKRPQTTKQQRRSNRETRFSVDAPARGVLFEPLLVPEEAEDNCGSDGETRVVTGRC